jgi:glucokinase
VQTVPPHSALGIDIGGTRIRVAAVTPDGCILARREAPLPPDGDPDPLRTRVGALAREIIDELQNEPQAVGVALPGIWDRRTGIMQRAINLPRLEGVDLRDLFATACGAAVVLDTDVNAAIWGQWHALTPRPERLVYLSLGTGVGGAVILDGQIVRHTRGGAGHFGFLVVDTSPDAPAGHTGVPGCLSAIAAGPALHPAASGEADFGALDAEPLPEAVLERAAAGLAVACVQLAHIYVPDLILLGGGVIDHHPELVDRARAAFACYTSKLIPADLPIERAPLLTQQAGVIGAALLALEK